MELFNEGSILFASYVILLFSNANFSDDLLNYGGWALIGSILLNLVVNVGIMLKASVKKFIRRIKKFKFRRHIRRIKTMEL